MNDSLQILELNQKVNLLEYKIDSIYSQNTLRKLEFEINQRQDILSSVNEFYDSAWLKLIIIISILGIVIPILAQYFQRRNLRDLTDFIQTQLKEGFDLRLSELKQFNKTEIKNSIESLQEQLNDLDKKNKNLLVELDTSTFFLQGRASLVDKDYKLAIPSFLRAAYNALQSERNERVKAPLVNVRMCLSKISDKEILTKVSNYLKSSNWGVTLDEAIDYFEKHEDIEIYKSILDDIKKQLKKIKNGG